MHLMMSRYVLEGATLSPIACLPNEQTSSISCQYMVTCLFLDPDRGKFSKAIVTTLLKYVYAIHATYSPEPLDHAGILIVYNSNAQYHANVIDVLDMLVVVVIIMGCINAA